MLIEYLTDTKYIVTERTRMGFVECLIKTVVGMLLLQVVVALADECLEKKNCNECIRTRGCDWCFSPTMPDEPHRCRAKKLNSESDWCPGSYLINPMDQRVVPQRVRSLSNVESTHRISTEEIYVDTRLGSSEVHLQYRSKYEPNMFRTFTGDNDYLEINTPNDLIKLEPPLSDGSSLYNVTMLVTLKDCPNADHDQSMTLTVESLVNITVNPICNCDCGEKAERDSKKCQGNGVWHCGVCTCNAGWYGQTCGGSSPECPSQRGDLNECSTGQFGSVECSGRGECVCGKCKCYHDINNHFDDDCTDFCAATAKCAICLNKHNDTNQHQGPCTVDCEKTRLDIWNDENGHLNLWPSPTYCTIPDDEGCMLEYTGIIISKKPLLRLGNRNCSMVYAVPVTGLESGVPVGGIVAAVLIAAVAVAGFLAWKVLQKSPDTLVDGGFDNLDPEMNEGENPLYRSPNSSFRNPLYQETKKG